MKGLARRVAEALARLLPRSDRFFGELFGWRNIRSAELPQGVRDELERFGMDVVTYAMASSVDIVQPALRGLVAGQRDVVLAWLTEQRDIAERARQRTETVEVAILLFVIIGVLLDLMLLMFRHG